MPAYKLVTVNTAPDRAKRIIGRIVEEVKDRWTIVHAANVERIDDLRDTLLREQPDVMFAASMWTPDEVTTIMGIAQATIPGIKTLSIPYGLQSEKGPDGVVEFVEGKLPEVLGS